MTSDGHLDEVGDIEMEETTPDKSDLSGSDSDVHLGSKRKARKQSAKVCVFVCYIPTVTLSIATRDRQSVRGQSKRREASCWRR